MSEAAAASTVARRRDRKAEIAVAAAPLFCDLGYHRVGIDDVAEAVGITGGAIYRHFANKSEILARTLRDGLAVVAAAVDDLPGSGAEEDLAEAVDRLAALALDSRGFGILLEREVRHLPDADRTEVLAQVAATTQRLAALAAAVRPELSADDAWLLAHAVLSGTASPSYHSVTLGRQPAEALLRRMAADVFATTAVPTLPASASSPAEPIPAGGPLAGRQRRSSRREMLLGASIQLFGSRGYWAVRMEDVGAAAGIAGPSIYQYFPGKADLLVAALNRGAEWLQLGLSSALTAGTSAGDALERVVDSYVGFVLEHPDLMSLLLTESVYLPDDDRHVLRRTQHDYVDEWATLLVAVRPDLDHHEALFLTHCVLGIINDGARSERVLQGWDARALLGHLGREVLGLELLVEGRR